jgi:dihydropteroate synthase
MPCEALRDLGKRPLIMGIVNVTPDSFSGDGLLASGDFVKAALDQALQMIEDGADILDIGGESTRPGHDPVPADEEKRRVLPVIEAIRGATDMPISIDTGKTEVASAALDSGASILNDVSGLNADPSMYELAAKTGAYLVLMHNSSRNDAVEVRGIVGASYASPTTNDIVTDVAKDFEEMIHRASSHGIAKDRLILDPGLGFGKTVEQNLKLVSQLDRFKSFGLPLFLGPSRKSFIGAVLNAPPDERLAGTLAIATVGLLRGADILRVHDVKPMADAAKILCALEGESGT